MTHSDENIVELIRDRIFNIDPDTEVYLFGSRARGDANEDSDWDILILVDDDRVTNEIDDKFRDPLYDLELETGQVISLFVYPKSDWESNLKFSPFYKNVNSEGLRL